MFILTQLTAKRMLTNSYQISSKWEAHSGTMLAETRAEASFKYITLLTSSPKQTFQL